MTCFRSMFVVLLLCATLPVAQAAPLSTMAQDEVNHLLTHLAQSGCEFNRNGTWYDAAKAREHLQTKYDYLLRKEKIATAEDFIRLAATESSVSGKPYQVRCPFNASGANAVASATWLTQELIRYRQRSGTK